MCVWNLPSSAGSSVVQASRAARPRNDKDVGPCDRHDPDFLFLPHLQAVITTNRGTKQRGVSHLMSLNVQENKHKMSFWEKFKKVKAMCNVNTTHTVHNSSIYFFFSLYFRPKGSISQQNRKKKKKNPTIFHRVQQLTFRHASQ